MPDAVQAEEPGLESIEGSLRSVTYHDEDSGYTVARLLPEGGGASLTVVGRMAFPAVGASLRLRGRWATHPRYGRQFEAQEISERLPATIDGVRRYLGSGMIPGVGPVTADKIVDHFGAETLEVIDNEPERLSEVPGVGAVRSRQIRQAWRDQQRIKELMLFLQSHGVASGLAVRIYKRYGEAAASVVRHDPYRLAVDVFGVGFKTADRIARQLGIPPDAGRRVEAGVAHALSEMAGEGHVFAWRTQLVAACVDLLAPPADWRTDGAAGVVGPELVQSALDRMARSGALRIDRDLAAALRSDAEDGESAVYLPPLHAAEAVTADRILGLVAARQTRLEVFRDFPWRTALSRVDGGDGSRLSDRQRAAVRTALTSKVAVLTGGPGTGKTTTVRAVLRLLLSHGLSVALAAPTGRAAKRLSETCGVPAKTIHRTLELKPAQGWQFGRNEANPIAADMVVVDEMSMVDLSLMSSLLSAVDPRSHLLLVGDPDQLPSVGPGAVLRDLIESGAVPVVALDQVFRQPAGSYIVENAHRINRGEAPVFENDSRDFFLFPADDAEQAARWVVDVVSTRIPARFGLDPLADVQVLSPMHRGAAGVSALNERLQAVLNPPAPEKPELAHGARVFRLGDKVMQLRNNYAKDVFNGDLGRVVAVDRIERRVDVAFDGTAVPYDTGELDEIAHAFACSTHKSQGAEYPAVVMALVPQHYMLLQRNLLYTAVTRARRLCVIVGSKRAIGMAVRNDRVAERNSGLAWRLRRAAAAPTASVGR